MSPVFNGTQHITLSVTGNHGKLSRVIQTRPRLYTAFFLQSISIYSKGSTTWVFQVLMKHSLADHETLFTDIFGSSSGESYEEPPTSSIYFDISSSIIKQESKYLRRRIHFFRCQKGKGPNRHMHVIVWPTKHVKATKPKINIYLYTHVRIYSHITQRSLKKDVGWITKIAAPEILNKQMSTRTAHS